MESLYKIEKLGNYIEQIRGISYKPSDLNDTEKEGYKVVLRANSIQDNKLVLDDLIYVKEELIKEKQVIKKDDILLAASSGSKEVVGKSVQIKEDTDYSFGAFCKIIRCKKNINSKYVAYFFRTKYYRAIISSVVNGANINNLKNEHIDDLLIPIPSLETQNKIVEVLDKAQSLIDKKKEQIELLDKLVKSRFIDMFGDPMINPYNWETIELKEIMKEKAMNGFFAKNTEYKEDGNSQVMWLGDVINRRYSNTKGLKRVDVTEKELEKYRVKYGDLLFCRSSLTKEGIGKASAVPRNIENNIMFECHIIKVNLDLEKCIPEFMQIQSSMDYFRNQIMSKSKTATMTTIGQEGIVTNKVILPPLEKQKIFVEFVRKIDEIKSKMETSLSELEDNFNSLMQKAFKGELF